MSNRVYIIKLGNVLSPLNMLPGGSGDKKATIMLVEEDSIVGLQDIIGYYISVLRDSVKDRYILMKTKGIVRQPNLNGDWFNTPSMPVIGVSDGDPIIGSAFTINNSHWHTSSVLEIIEEDIFITKNSVYLIYNKSKERDKKLKNLGI